MNSRNYYITLAIGAALCAAQAQAQTSTNDVLRGCNITSKGVIDSSQATKLNLASTDSKTAFRLAAPGAGSDFNRNNFTLMRQGTHPDGKVWWIMSENSGRCAAEDRTAVPWWIAHRDCSTTTSAATKWILQNAGGGYYYVVSFRNTNAIWDMKDAGVTNGTRLQTQTRMGAGAKQQMFTFRNCRNLSGVGASPG